MKQTLHIFRKDARRFWRDIVVVIFLFGVYAAIPPGAGRNFLMPLATLLACWELAASAVQEDGPTKDSSFWMTRPYGRWNLIVAKVLFAFVFVFFPMFVSGAVITVRTGASVGANLGNLVVEDVLRSLFFTLPGLALGTVTSSLRELLGYAAVLIVIWNGSEIYSAGRWGGALTVLPSSWNYVALAPAVAGLMAVIGMQFLWRKTPGARVVFAMSAVVYGLLTPIDSVARFSTRAAALADGWNFNANAVSVSFDESQPPRIENLMEQLPCYSIPMKVEGLPNGTMLRVKGDYGPSFGWARVGTNRISLRESGGGYRFYICGTGLENTLNVAVPFEVVATTRIAGAPLRRGTFPVGNAGQCTVPADDFPVELKCEMLEPVNGTMSAGLEFAGYRSYTSGFPDLSTGIAPTPVREKSFEGSFITKTNWDMDEALRHPEAKVVLRSERTIADLRRDLAYRGLGRRTWNSAWGQPPKE